VASGQSKSKINRGIIFDNEKSYLIDVRKFQEVLAKALHKLYGIYCSIVVFIYLE